MKKNVQLINAYIEVPDGDDLPPRTYGSYDFVALPRVGERLELTFGESELSLRVKDVSHRGYGVDATPTPYDCMVRLTCERLNA